MRSLASALQQVAAAADLTHVYVDANLPQGFVSALRHDLGWDVLSVVEHDDLRRATDRFHFVHALELERTLITQDLDFADADRFPPAIGPGVVVLSAPDESTLIRLARHLDQSIFERSRSVRMPLRGQALILSPDVLPARSARRRGRRAHASAQHARTRR